MLSNQSDKEKESKKLRELDKFWQTVRDDPSDFIGWTYLLQYVDGAVNSLSYIYKTYRF